MNKNMTMNMKRILALLLTLLPLVACNNFPVDEDGLLITNRGECYVGNFNILDTDLQTVVIGNAYVDTTAQVVVAYVKYGTPLTNLWPQVSLCEDAKLTPKITERMDFTPSKMDISFVEGDWSGGSPTDQLSERIVADKSSFPSGAKKFSVIAGNRKIKKEYTFLVVERELQ